MGAKPSSVSEQRDLYHAVLEHAPLPMAIVEGATHTVLHANPAFCRLVNLVNEDLAGRPLSEVLPAKDSCVKLLDRVFRTRAPETHTEREDAKARPLFWSYTMWPVLTDDRHVGIMIQVTETAEIHDKTVAMNEALILGSVRQHELTQAADEANVRLVEQIAVRERAEAALRENEWRLRYAADSAKLTYVELDLASGQARTPENFATVMGYAPPPEWLADVAEGVRVLLGHVIPADRPRVAASLEEFVAGKPAGRIDYRVMGDDQVERWIESRWTAEFAADGRPLKSFATNLDITERKLAEAALRESEQFNRSIMESSPDCIKVLDLAGNLVSFLRGAWELLGIEDVRPYLNTPWIAFWKGEDREAARTAIAEAAAGGEGNFVGFFRTLRDEDKWWDVKISPISDATGQPFRLLVVSRDVTTRKLAEMNLEFLASISMELVGLTDLEETMSVVGTKIGTHFDLSACAFVEVNDPAAQVVISHDWHRPDVPGLVGVYALKDFVDGEFVRMAQAGETIVVRDTATDPRTSEAKYATLGIASFLCVPVIRDGQWAYALCLYRPTAYAWREDEIELARELTGRIWTCLERLRAETALRASEERYRSLFTSIDEGFCVVDVIFDDQGKAVDWRYLEVNPSFEKQTGMSDITGRRIRELSPDHEEYWFETYGKVALTGEPVRFVNEAKVMNHSWFDLYAFKVGGPESRKVAILFTNITERRNTGQALEEQARLLDLSTDAIIVRDMEGRIRYWNLGATKLYGWSRDEAMGEISHILLQTELPVSGDQLLEELCRTNHWAGEMVHTKRDGERITALTRKTLVRDGEGTPVEVMENITDITELKESLMLQERLRGMSHLILQAQEEERKRISRELHDVVAQTLVGINVHVAGLAHGAEGIPRSFQLKVARTHRLVEKAVEVVHRFARELRPTVLDDLGLIPALQSYIKGFMNDTGVRVSLKTFREIEDTGIQIRTVLFRVAQEALTNVFRHAEASHASVTLRRSKGRIFMEITDNGRGFEVAGKALEENRNCLGLLGMKERVEMVGGTFHVDSAPGKCTTVRVGFTPSKLETPPLDS